MAVIITFNPVVWWYEILKKIILGNAPLNAECHFHKSIPDPKQILVIGGGEGKSALNLEKTYPKAEITFLEPSSKMISRAKKHLNPKTIFITGTLNDLESKKHDLIIISFVLDLFHEPTIIEMSNQIKEKLSPNGKLIVTDFEIQKNYFKKLFISIMYQFFSLFLKLDTKSLPPVFDILKKQNWFMTKEKYFYSGIIKTVVLNLSKDSSI